MTPEKIDATLKDKVKELKDQKRHDELVGLISLMGENLVDSIKEIQIDAPIVPPITVPEIKIPDINVPQANVTVNVPDVIVPEIKVPVPQVTVNVPDVIVPPIVVPEPKVTVNIEKPDAPIVNIPPFPTSMDIQGSVSLEGIDRKSPLPVMMMGPTGKPLDFTQSVGGGRGDFFTIKDIQNSTGGSIIDNDGFVKVTGSFSVSSSPFATYYASDAIGSMNIIQIGGNPIVVGTGYSDNAIRVTQATDVALSVNVTGASGTLATSLVDSTGIQYSGSNPVPVVFSSTSSTASSLIDSSGVQYSGSNPLPITIVSGNSTTTGAYLLNGDGTYRDTVPISGTVTVSSITASTAITILNGEGVARDTWNIGNVISSIAIVNLDRDGNPWQPYTTGQGDSAFALRVLMAGDSVESTNIVTFNGNTPAVGTNETTNGVLRTIQMSDTIASVFVTGSPDSMTAWMARTTLPTAKSDGADVRPIGDKYGRQITYPYTMRDTIGTAYITLSTSAAYNTETVLIPIGTGTNDILMLSGTNDSTATALFDVRCGTANASVSRRIIVPANSGFYHEDFNIPLLGEITTPWTVKAFISGGGSADITGTNVTLSALYIKN